MNHDLLAATHVPRTAVAPGDEQSLPFGEGIFIVSTACPGDACKAAVGETS